MTVRLERLVKQISVGFLSFDEIEIKKVDDEAPEPDTTRDLPTTPQIITSERTEFTDVVSTQESTETHSSTIEETNPASGFYTFYFSTLTKKTFSNSFLALKKFYLIKIRDVIFTFLGNIYR